MKKREYMKNHIHAKNTRKYEKKNTENTARKRNRAVKPIARRYIV
jgi:hypothetical protein